MRILVVEDNPDAGSTLRMVLDELGHKVRLVHDGESALEVVIWFRPHVVILDLGLPGLDGHETALLMRHRVRSEKMMMVALSGWGSDQVRELSKVAGIEHHLVKPLDLDALNGVLSLHPESGGK